MKDFSLQGEVFLGASNNGKPGAMFATGDAATLQISPSSSEEKRKENQSGNRGVSATINTGIEVAFTLTLHHGTSKNLALGLYGEEKTVAAASVTAEDFPDGLVAGDLVVLDRGNISSVVIEDSAGTPATLVENTHYSIEDAIGGIIKMLDVAGHTQPYNIDYDHGGSTDVLMFTQQPPVRYLIMNGLNTVDGSTDRIRCRMYKLKFNPVGQLDLINGTFGELQLSGTALLDTTAELDAALGGYGRIELLD
ncbi:hypothetical protein [Neptuniibacter sp.]|uniref:phage tail tube protein n=1 Tax=Neptuniibacter sp. TaxID=1962643 RepID=UPI003B5A07B7